MNTETNTITLSRFYPPRMITVETDDAEVRIAVRVRRMKRGDFVQTFGVEWAALDEANLESRKSIYRKADSDEHARDERGRWIVTDDEIRARRMAEMTTDERAAFLALEAREADATLNACARAVSQFVEVAPALPDGTIQRVEVDGRPVKTGADLVDLFDGSLPVLSTLAGLIRAEHTMQPDEKKGLRSRFDSSTGSRPNPPASGATPAETAGDAASAASVASASVDA